MTTQTTTHFRRQPNGSYAFDVQSTGTTYYAYRNEAGFAGRQWYVTRLDSLNVETTVADMLASRTECVEVAEEDAAASQRDWLAEAARFDSIEGVTPPAARTQTFHHVHVAAPDGARAVAAAAAELELVGRLPQDATMDVQSVHSCSPRFTGQPVRYHVLIAAWSSEPVEEQVIAPHAGCIACNRCAAGHLVDFDPGDPEVGPRPNVQTCFCTDGLHGEEPDPADRYGTPEHEAWLIEMEEEDERHPATESEVRREEGWDTGAAEEEPAAYEGEWERCGQCGRRDHRPGTFDGHQYVGPDEDPAPVTALEVAEARGLAPDGEGGGYSGAAFAAVGVPIMGGCGRCGAMLAAYNAYPSRTGYWMCREDIGDDGFPNVTEYETFEARFDSIEGITPPAERTARCRRCGELTREGLLTDDRICEDCEAAVGRS